MKEELDGTLAAPLDSQEDYCSTARQSVRTRSLNVNTHVGLRLPSCVSVVSSTCFCLPSSASSLLHFSLLSFSQRHLGRERGGADR